MLSIFICDVDSFAMEALSGFLLAGWNDNHHTAFSFAATVLHLAQRCPTLSLTII